MDSDFQEQLRNLRPQISMLTEWRVTVRTGVFIAVFLCLFFLPLLDILSVRTFRKCIQSALMVSFTLTSALNVGAF